MKHKAPPSKGRVQRKGRFPPGFWTHVTCTSVVNGPKALYYLVFNKHTALFCAHLNVSLLLFFHIHLFL